METKGVSVVPELPRMYTADESGTITLYNTAQPPTVSYTAVNEISRKFHNICIRLLLLGSSPCCRLVGALSKYEM